MNTEATVNIIKDICGLIDKGGGDCSKWHVGVARDPENHLFKELGIPRE